LICFIPLLSLSIGKKRTLIIYFIIQRVGSLAMLRLGRLGLIVCAALALKISLAPFHFWAPSLVDSLKGVILVIFLTWQKVAPLFVLLRLSLSLILLALVNIVIGALLALSAVGLPVLLLFSGLRHARWVVRCSVSRRLVYFIFYCALVSLILLDKSPSKIIQLICLAGLPPITGFIIKILALQGMSAWIWPILLAGSSLVIYAYMRGFMAKNVVFTRPMSVFVCWGGLFLI